MKRYEPNYYIDNKPPPHQYEKGLLGGMEESSTGDYYLASEVDARIAHLVEKWHREGGITRHPLWMTAAKELKEAMQ